MALTDLNLTFYPRSLVYQAGVEYGLAQTSSGSKLILLASTTRETLDGFEGECSELDGKILLVGPVSAKNAQAFAPNSIGSSRAYWGSLARQAWGIGSVWPHLGMCAQPKQWAGLRLSLPNNPHARWRERGAHHSRW